MAVLGASGYLRRQCSRASRLTFGLVLAASRLWAPWDSCAQQTPPSEYQVKAAFLFHFTEFVDWPPQAFTDPQTPLVIGVLGQDPFGAQLDAVVRGETVNGRPLAVERYHRVEDIKTCHILFINRSESDRLDKILASLKDRSVLTVSDAERFAGRGGMIRFLTDKNKIRLRINLGAAKAAKLTLSSNLLRLAEVVTTERD